MSSLQDDKIPRKGLDDIIVSQETMNQIRDIIHFEKARKVLESQWGFAETFPDNNGLAVLFYGPPGTGKTLAAEAIAYETGKTLKYVNYAQVLSKYIGETEKALEALFKDVASHESILFFDEADALFSKRIADGTANARYINIEVDILLRQIERNNVFAILTTNFIQNIDQAFLRRMRYIVEFGNPGIDLRIRLWKLLIPEKLPVADDVDFDVLSRMYEFTGGDIKNIIIRAAVNKALNFSEDVRISMQDLLDTCKVYNEIMLDSKHRKIGFGV